MIERILEIAVGCAFIGIGVAGRRFAWGGFGASRRDNAPTLPRWFGGTLFMLGGAWFIYLGIRGL